MSRVRRTGRLAVHAAETATASATTIAARTARLAAPGGHTDPEATRMVTEKLAAAGEAAVAMAPAMVGLGTAWLGWWSRQSAASATLAGRLATARTPADAMAAWTQWGSRSAAAAMPLGGALVDVATRGLQPYRQRSRANARRLG